MAIYPGAEERIISWANSRDDNTDPTIVVLHLTASEATSMYSYFSGIRHACSNFHVDRKGNSEQYIDTSRLSAAEYYGSDDAISIETQGADGNGRWTEEQVEEIAQILAWIHKTHGIPLRLKTTSSPTERGIGWHRLGCSGNFETEPEILRGRNQRGYAGEAWSTAFGKICPGSKRILQIRDEILPRAIEIAGGDHDSNSKPIERPVWTGDMGWRKLRIGARGEAVEELQEYLNDFGYKLTVDGSFGEKTDGALKNWQKKYDLEADGVVGPNTQKKMKATNPPTSKPVSKPKPETKPTPAKPKPKPKAPQLSVDGVWGSGTTKRLQEVLGMQYVDGEISRQSSAFRNNNPGLTSGWDWNGDRRDGGSQTIKTIQRRVGVSVDGKIGPETIRGMQRHFGTPVDSVVSKPSTMVKAMQRRLNDGKF